MINYNDGTYWEKVYTEQQGYTYEWGEDYETIKPIIDELNISKSGNILNIGCGNSEMGERMYDDGYLNNYNIDFSRKVIQEMSSRRPSSQGLNYECMNVMDIRYENDFFDLVVDKGTMDAMGCDVDGSKNVVMMTKEVARCLKNNGYYILGSFGTPEKRGEHLRRAHLNFDINVYDIKKEDAFGGNDPHYIYICKNCKSSVYGNYCSYEDVIEELNSNY